ncbi:MAG: hypothetical protein LJE95_12715 [Acidobacteria bacterium]|nr:hypothetical protein [Acidobacteriota bacterium]
MKLTRCVGCAIILTISLAFLACTAGGDERHATERALGVTVEEFPTGQGPAGFDDLPDDTPQAAFAVEERQVSGPSPREDYEKRPIVRAQAPDGSVYEAYCGYAGDEELAPAGPAGSGNRRQSYGTHHGATYYPESVFIGKRQNGRINATLVFPDVGSHTTAPHSLAVDSRGECHLAVADVNIYQDNRLELYWVVGDPVTGKWTKAWLLERRGFTSWAYPGSVAWGDSVHLLWTWVNASDQEALAQCGLFHVKWSPRGFSRKVRVAAGGIDSWDLALAPESGLLLVVFSTDEGVFGATWKLDSAWTKPAKILPEPSWALSLEASNEAFILRTGSEHMKEWLVKSL